MEVPIGRRVRLFRDALGLTQLQLAMRSGISLDYVSAIERGQRVPSVQVLEHLADTLGVPPSILVGESARTGEDMERRQVLAGLAAGVVAPIAAADLLLRGFAAALGDRPSLDEWAAKVDRYGQEYMTLGAAELQPRLAADLVVLQAQLDEPERWAVAGRLLALYAKTTPGAQNSSRWYELAVRAADRSGQLETRTWVRGRAALALAYEGAALGLADRLADQALGLSCQPSLARLNALTAKAHVLAFRGDRSSAYATLEQARRVFEVAGSHEQVSDYAVPEWRFHTFASMLLSRMGDERHAVQEQEAADRSRPAQLRRFATHIEMHRGLMLVHAGDVGAGAAYAHDALAKLPPERHSLTLRLLLAEVERAAARR